MGRQRAQVARAAAVKAEYEEELLRYPNVIGVGVGHRCRRGEYTDEVCIVVIVTGKQPASALREEDLLPTELDGVPVDVLDVGPIVASDLTGDDEGAEPEAPARPQG